MPCLLQQAHPENQPDWGLHRLHSSSGMQVYAAYGVSQGCRISLDAATPR